MTSLFDSAVADRRKHTPWAEIDLKDFLTDLAINADYTPITLQVQYRPSVASRLWWSLTWKSEDGEEHQAEAQTMELCLWRAAEMELRLRAKEEKRAQGTKTAPPV